jgi:glycosyltransferase involved in cell wall biosynthesis
MRVGESEGDVRVAVIIPALNEAETIGPVVAAACRARTVDEVIVVDNGSTDDTAAIAAANGARVVSESSRGKGEAMRRGVAATGAPILVFLDADLYGVEPRHVEALASRLLADKADMACGLCDRGSTRNTLQLHYLPILSGQRALRRELFLLLAPEEASGYKVEVALNSLVKQRKLRRRLFILTGVRHRTREEKAPHPVTGFLHKLRMLLSAAWSYLSFSFRHRVLDGIVAALSQR